MPLRWLIIVACLVSGCEERPNAKQLDKEGFAQAYIESLNTEMPGLTVEQKGRLELLVVGDDDVELTVYLDNAYHEYQASPDDLDAILQSYTGAMVEAFSAAADDDSVDLTRVVPVIKDWQYLIEAEKVFAELGGDDAKKQSLYHEPLNEHLVLLYAEDSPQSVQYLNRDKVDALSMSAGALRAQAVRNLMSMLPDVQVLGDDDVYMVVADGIYEASLLLLDDVWSQQQMPVLGDYVVAIPSRDVLLVTGSDNAAGISRVRAYARDFARESNYSISDRLFVRRDGRWVPFDD